MGLPPVRRLTLRLPLTPAAKTRRPELACAAHRAPAGGEAFWSPSREMLQMKYMHKAIWQSDGNLVIRGNTRALLFRALDDVRADLAQRGEEADQLKRTVAALQEVLGSYEGRLPSALELLGDPVQERVSRNLLRS
jgi:hypothetical protein